MNNSLWFHEAAHAVCGWYVGFGVKEVQVASYMGQRLYSHSGIDLGCPPGFTEYRRRLKTHGRLSRKYGRDRILVAAAGPLMNRLLGHIPTGAGLFSILGQSDEIAIKRVVKHSNITIREADRYILRCEDFLQEAASLKAASDIALRLSQSGKVAGCEIESICSQHIRNRTFKRWRTA